VPVFSLVYTHHFISSLGIHKHPSKLLLVTCGTFWGGAGKEHSILCPFCWCQVTQ